MSPSRLVAFLAVLAALVPVGVLSGASSMAMAAEGDGPVAEGQALATCRVAGVSVQEGLLLIRCAEATADGVTQFGVDRSTRRFEDIRDFAAWAQEKDRPLGVLYYTDPARSPRGCAPDICRHLLGVERR
ncbi:MAG: hypothetical protein GC145_02220 [Caulobacter sp.]|nr:hypothetical protein [Caulobacter sp.]